MPPGCLVIWSLWDYEDISRQAVARILDVWVPLPRAMNGVGAKTEPFADFRRGFCPFLKQSGLTSVRKTEVHDATKG